MLNARELLRRLVRLLEPKDRPGWEKEWEADPLSHPDLQRMTLEQLADLPFERGERRQDRDAPGIRIL